MNRGLESRVLVLLRVTTHIHRSRHTMTTARTSTRHMTRFMPSTSTSTRQRGREGGRRRGHLRLARAEVHRALLKLPRMLPRMLLLLVGVGMVRVSKRLSSEVM